MKKFKDLLAIGFILLISFWAIKPLINYGFFPIHDDTQIARVFEMHKSLQDGMFPVRWVNDLGYGYGYPIFNFYGPLPYYIGALFMLVGLNALLSTKLTMIVGILVSGVSMYLLARDFWGKKGALMSALLYVYATYHAVDIYVRGDLGEFFAYGLIPLVFYGIYQFNQKKSLNYAIIGALSFSGVILSHNLTAFMLSLFLGIFCAFLIVVNLRKQQNAMAFVPFLPLILGGILSAFYILPVIFEAKYTNVLSQVGGSADFHKHFVCINQLWYSPWGFGGSTPGCIDGLSFMLGKTYFLFIALALFSLGYFWKNNPKLRNVLLIAIVALLISLFMLLDVSTVVWELIPFLNFVQYPWRFLIFVYFFCSFIGGSIFYPLSRSLKNTKNIQIILITLLIFSASVLIMLQAKFFFPQKIVPVSASYYTDTNQLIFNTSRVSDEYLPKDFSKPKNVSTSAHHFISEGKKYFTLSLMQENTIKKQATFISKNSSQLVLNIAYFPAWHIFIDKKEVRAFAKEGKISITVPAGKHEIIAQFLQTPIEQLGNAFSVAGLISILIGIILVKRKSYDKTS